MNPAGNPLAALETVFGDLSRAVVVHVDGGFVAVIGRRVIAWADQVGTCRLGLPLYAGHDGLVAKAALKARSTWQQREFSPMGKIALLIEDAKDCRCPQMRSPAVAVYSPGRAQ